MVKDFYKEVEEFAGLTLREILPGVWYATYGHGTGCRTDPHEAVAAAIQKHHDQDKR